MRLAILVSLMLFAGCAARTPVVTPHLSGAGPADGIVTLASTRTLFNPVRPDWGAAFVTADGACHAQGRDGPARFAGDQQACEIYDRAGRCVRTTVTRFYSCGE